MLVKIFKEGVGTNGRRIPLPLAENDQVDTIDLIALAPNEACLQRFRASVCNGCEAGDGFDYSGSFSQTDLPGRGHERLLRCWSSLVEPDMATRRCLQGEFPDIVRQGTAKDLRR